MYICYTFYPKKLSLRKQLFKSTRLLWYICGIICAEKNHNCCVKTFIYKYNLPDNKEGLLRR